MSTSALTRSRLSVARKDEMPPRMRGHPLSPPEDPSSNPNEATQPHAELYERTADAQDPLFPNSPPLESQGAEMQRTISQLARFEAADSSEAAASVHGNESLASQRSLQIATTSAQRTSTPSSVRSRAASPLASPTAPSAYAAFADPFSSIVPARLSFPSAPHRLPDEAISSIPLSHLVALVKALSRDLDEAQASLRTQRAELAALEKLVRDKGASEGEVERVKVRARTGSEEEAGDAAGTGKRVASGVKLAADEWSIDLPPTEEGALPPPKTEVDLDIDDLTEAISSNAFDLGLTPVVPPPPLAAPADDEEASSVRSRALSLPEGSGAPPSAAGEIASSVSSAPAPVMNPTLPTTIGTKSNRPRHASLSARFVGYIAGAPPPSSSPTPSGSSVVSPRKSQDATAATAVTADASSSAGSKSQKRPRSGSIRSVNSVASSVTSGGGGERKSYGESSWLGGWRWGKSSSHAAGGGATSSLKEAAGAETEEEEEGGANGGEDAEEGEAVTPLAAPATATRAESSGVEEAVVEEGVAALERTRSPSRSRSSSTGSTSSPAESGERSSSRPSSRRTSQTARSTVDTTLPGSPPPLKSPATSSSLAIVEDRAPLLSPPESPTLTRRRSSAVTPNRFQPSVQQSTAAAVLSTPLTASTISLPSASPNRLTGYGSSGPTSPARSPTSNTVALPDVLELPGGPPEEASAPSGDATSDARLRFVPGVPLYSALAADVEASKSGGSSASTTTASDRLVASAKGTINRALGLRPTPSQQHPPGISRTSSHSSQSTSSAADAALNGLLHHLPSKLPPLSLARYSPFSQPALSMPATHVSLSASTASLTTATSSAGPAGSPLIAHTAVLAPASAASGAQTMELDTISAEAAPPSLALLKPSYQSAAAAAGVAATAIDEDDDGPMIDRFGFIYDVHTGMALLKESRRRKAGEHLAAAAVDAKEAEGEGDQAAVVAGEDERPSNKNRLELPGVPAVMTTPQTELEVHPQLDALREAIGLTPTVEAENALSPPTSPSQLPAPDPDSSLGGAVSNSADRPVKLVRAPSSSNGTSRRASPLPNGTGPQSMRALLVQLRTMTDALEQSQQAAWDAFIRRRQRKLAKLKQAQLEEHHQQHYEDKAPAGRDRERDHHRLQSVFQADEVESDPIEQDVWTSENLVGVAQMGTEKKGKKEDWNEFKELVRKGIPIAYRPKIWGECSSANEAREPGVYQELLAQPATEAEAPCLKQIDMDCHRTFPTNVFFAGNGPGVAKLRNVLVAYSRRDPKVGYCQGMNNLVATLLLTHPAEEDAFWVLVCIIENILPSDYYTSHLLVSRADQQVLKDLVDRTLPKLSAHLEEQGVELSAITFGWFLSLFTDCLPIQTLLRVWDLFFIHGTIFLFRIALAILKLHEPELLECDSAAGLYAMLGQLPAGLWNADRLLKVACDDLASAVKDRVVASLRNKHVRALEAEMGIGAGGDDDSLAELARVELEGRRLNEDVASARSLDLFVSLTSPLSRADAMEGVAIADLTGRKILSTHFASPLRATLALDAAANSTHAIVWVPSTATALTAGDSDPSDDEDEEDGAHAWDDSSTRRHRRGGAGGVAVCQIIRNGLRFMAPVTRDVDPVVPLTFLADLYHVLETYISGPVTEATIKDNFDVVLALMHEMLAGGGRPQLTQTSQLKEFVTPPDSQLLAKVATAVNAATSAGITLPSQASAANALVASPLPWRRQGIKYTSNEIYLDLTETLTALLDPSGKPLVGSISGQMDCRSRLSGMPDLSLSFTDPSILGDAGAAFHSCVRYHRWRKEKIVSFVPPDGAFTLLTFQHKPPLPLMTTTSARLAAALLLPFSLTSSHTLGTLGGAFHLTLTSRASLANLVVRIPLADGVEGAGQVQASVSGGALLRDEEGRSIGGGAGRYEVVEEEEEVSATATVSEGPARRRRRLVLVWQIEKLAPTDRPAVLSGQYNITLPNARKPPSFTLTFDSPAAGFSGLRVDSLKVLNEVYNVYKGVKMVGRGEIEVRT